MHKFKVNTSKIPIPIIKKRTLDKEVYDEAIDLGLNHIASKILAQRSFDKENVEIDKIISPSIKDIPDFGNLKDIVKAAERIGQAVINKEHIGLACDFDVDGISSAAVMVKALKDYFNVPEFYIHVYFSHRMKVGYGFTEDVANRILNTVNMPTLVITADQGSGNGATVEYIKKEVENRKIKNIDIIISDHHHIQNFPKEAFAFINPQRSDDKYEDKTICGCTVALFLMSQVRKYLIESTDFFNEENTPKLGSLLSYSTAATIADCVSMASPVNRAIVLHGISEMNSEVYPAWSEVRRMGSLEGKPQDIDVESLGFGLGPRINACSRTGGDGMAALKFYLSEDKNEAVRYLGLLSNVNEERKLIEKKLIFEAFNKAIEAVEKGYSSLVIFLPEGHHGVHGIVASRVVERFGKPVICLSPKKIEQKEVDFDFFIKKMGWSKEKLDSEIKKIKKDKTYKINDIERFDITVSQKKVFKAYEVKYDSKGELKEKTQKHLFQIKGLNYENLGLDLNKLGLNKSEKVKTKIVKENFNNINKEIKISKTKGVILYYDIEIKINHFCVTEITGSARSVEGLSINSCLKSVSSKTKIFNGWGGHDMAAGMSLNVEHLDQLKTSFENEVLERSKHLDLLPVVYHDGYISDPENQINMDFYKKVNEIYPFGNGFPKPSFLVNGKIKSLKITNETAVFKISFGKKDFTAFAFKWQFNPMEKRVKEGDDCEIVISLRQNIWKENVYLQFLIEHIKPL